MRLVLSGTDDKVKKIINTVDGRRNVYFFMIISRQFFGACYIITNIIYYNMVVYFDSIYNIVVGIYQLYIAVNQISGYYSHCCTHRSPLTTSPITELPKSDHFETEENIKEKNQRKINLYTRQSQENITQPRRYRVLYDV